MKTAVVPAQITTVEDKVAGNLSLTQLLLIASPVFLSGILYAILPPGFETTTYKITLISFLFCSFAVLAVRINGQLLLTWLIIFLRYTQRPRYYVTDKNSSYLRDNNTPSSHLKEHSRATSPIKATAPAVAQLNVADRSRIESILSNPDAKLSLSTTKKGALHVSIKKIK